ncbi:MAG: glycosyltransferase family 39 protein [Acidobacteriia bacterium]|nr:glycosyltransferase family 39 protein [Terriglobia bacterium]
MADTGDWVTPRLYGKPWFEKPPLYYWGAAISFRIFGVNDAAARLPSAICALLATLALAWLAWRPYGAVTARWLLLLLPSSAGMIGFSHAAATDMPFSGMLTVAMVAAAVVLRLDVSQGGEAAAGREVSKMKHWLALLAFGFFLGAAVLAKGPAAVILSGGAVFFWAVFTKRWRDAFRLFHPAALASFFATALPWYVLCARRNPDFIRVFIIEHNFKRFLTPEFQHQQPFWYYAPIFFIALLPWAVISLVSGASLIRKILDKETLSPSIVFLSTWTLFPLFFFTLSKSKLPGYILPAIPPAAALGAVYLAELLTAEEHRSRYRMLGAILAPVFGAAAALALALYYLYPAHSGIIAIGCGAFLLFLLGLVGFFTFTRRPAALLLAGIGCAVLCVTSANRLVLPRLDWTLSSRTAAQTFSVRPDANSRVAVFRLNRAWHYGLNYYLRAELPEYDLAGAAPGYVFVSKEGLEALRRSGVPYAELDSLSEKAQLVRIAPMEKK